MYYDTCIIKTRWDIVANRGGLIVSLIYKCNRMHQRKINYKLNHKNYNYKDDSYTRNVLGRSFGFCLHNRLLLSDCSMMFTIKPLGFHDKYVGVEM
jgi:hypothetical protein